MEGFFNYVIIEDGVVVAPGGGGGVSTLNFEDEGVSQGTAPILDVTGAGASIAVGGGKATLNVPAGSSTIEVQDDGSKIGDALILDFAGTGIQSAFGATKATLTLPEISTELLYVHPDFIDNALFGQYSTVEAAITRAKSLRGVGKFILIRVRAAIYQPTVQWDVHDGYGMIFDPGVLFDWSLWVGGTTFIQLAGFTYMKAAPLAFGIVGPHPFTGGKIVEALRVDPVTSVVSLVQVEGAFLWDGQGGAGTYGVHLNPSGGALGATPTMLFSNSLCSVSSGIGSVVVEGDWAFSAGGATKIACLFASALKQVDSGTDYPSCDIDISHLQSFGGVGVYDFEKSLNGTVSMNGSILELKRTNMDWFTDLAGLADGPINELNVLQFSYPDVAKPVEERYSLEAALLLIKQDMHDLTVGHDHDGSDSRKVAYSDLTGLPVFGTEDDASESDGESTTTSTSFQNKLTLTTASLPIGTYRIGWYAEIKSNDGTNDGCEGQVDLDAGTILAQVESMNADPGGISGGDGHWLPMSGMKRVAFGSAATHTIEIDFRQTSSNTARIRRARIEIWRVA